MPALATRGCRIGEPKRRLRPGTILGPLVLSLLGPRALAAEPAAPDEVVLEEQKLETAALMEMSLEALLDSVVVTASRQEEALFDAPLSTVVISGEELRRSGATTIAEALRLAPGLIVREQSAGVFDTTIRGLDGLLPGGQMFQFHNTLSLVMLDDRIVYNYLNGGIYWQTLEIDLLDVERIEIVRGSASALYGPNAVMGVIHIFTRHPEAEGFRLLGRAAGGAQAALRQDQVIPAGSGNLALHYRRGPWSAIVSVNAKENRREDLYYSAPDERYLPLSKMRSRFYEGMDKARHFPEPELALRQLGVNLYLNFDSSPYALSLSAGFHDARSQSGLLDLIWETQESRGFYLDLTAQVGGLRAHVDYWRARQSLIGWDTPLAPDMVLDPAEVFAAFLDYQRAFGSFKLGATLSYQRPRQASYAFAEEGEDAGDAALPSAGASLRLEQRPNSYFRWILAGRLDHYQNVEHGWNPSWQFIALTEPTKRIVARAVYGRSFRSPFLIESQISVQNSWTPGPTRMIGGIIIDSFSLQGDRDLPPFVLDTWELGFRQQLGPNLFIDGDLFLSRGDGFTVLGRPRELAQTLEVNPQTGNFRSVMLYQPVDTKVQILGGTAQLIYQPTPALTLKAHLTLQRTDLFDFVLVSFVRTEDPYSAPYDTQSHATPTLYGGLELGYFGIEGLSLRLNPYWMTGYELTHYEAGRAELSGSFYLMGHAEYQLGRAVSIFCTLRNLRVGNQQPQYVFGDVIRPSLYLGLTWSL